MRFFPAVMILLAACAAPKRGWQKDPKAAAQAPSQKASKDVKPAPPAPKKPAPKPKAGESVRVSDVINPPSTPPPPPDPKSVAKARRLVKKGLAFYYEGDYDAAEGHLKEAILIYPFLAEANLALGKIFLIRGSATRDPALINSARLMFEMAHALDEKGRETHVLLQLFMSQPKP